MISSSFRQRLQKQFSAAANIELNYKFKPNKTGDGAEISAMNTAVK